MGIDLTAAATGYLLARRARGYRLTGHEPLIFSFLNELAAQNAVGITRANALAFATAPPGTGRGWQAFRMSTIRGFATYVHGIDPESAELLPAGLITSTTNRVIPYLYSAEQIRELMSRSLTMLAPVLGVSMAAYVGLLAATGLRGGEAIALDVEDFLPEQNLLRVTGKYGRERAIPLHPSTVTALITYRKTRAAMTPEPVAGPFFIGATGQRLNHSRAQAMFRQVANQCVLPTSPGCRLPRLHDLRHILSA